MANPRAPFWVPRPADEMLWYPALENLNASGVLGPFTTQKFFGAGGQVPTTRWLPLYVQDDPPFWPGAPQSSRPIVVTLTQQKIFGQPGQGPTKNWAPQLLAQDDPPPWYPALNNLNSSGVLSPLTTQKIYGQGGQIPPFRPNFTYDDGAFWMGAPVAYKPGDYLKQTPSTQYRVNWYSEDSFWQGAPEAAAPIQLIAATPAFFAGHGQVPPFRPNFTIDDPPQFQGAPRGSWIIPQLTQAAGLAESPFFVPEPDDDTPWTQLIDNMNSFVVLAQGGVKVYGQPGQVPTYKQNFIYDDPSYWLGSPTPLNVHLQVPPGEPFTARVPYFYAETPEWQVTPADSDAIRILTSQRLFGQGGAVVPFRANLSYDDPPTWPAAPLPGPLAALITLQVTANITSAQTPFYVPRPGDESYWSGTTLEPLKSPIIRYLTLTTIYGAPGQTPPFRPNWTFDDGAFWMGAPTGSNNEILPQSAVNPFNNYPRGLWDGIEQDTFWLGTPSGSLTQFMLSGTAFSMAFFDTYEHETFWLGTPSAGNANVLNTPVTFPTATAWRWAPFNYDQDAPGFSGTPTRSFTLELLRPINAWRWTPFNYDVDAPGFTAKPSAAASLQQLILPVQFGQGGQVLPFRPNFTQDDPSVWEPVAYPPLILTQTKITYPPGSPVGFVSMVNRQIFWAYDVGDAALWQGAPVGSMYLLTNPTPPPIRNVSDFINFYRRGRRRS